MLAIIAAIDSNNGIGKDNKLLVHIKEDLQRFKQLTENNIIIMGYNTWESLPNKPLPNRINYVLTNKNVELNGANIIHSIDDIFKIEKENPNKITFIIGGGSLYKQMINYVDELYITKIMETFNADTYFPEITKEWKIKSINGNENNINHEHPHVFLVYKKNN